jgi:DNA-binding response OmpR family regulator
MDKYKILIVEDDDSIAHMVSAAVQMAGYLSEISDNGRDALEKIQQNKYDLILLDVMLPKLDGFSVMESVRTEEIPVIFMTARQEVSDRIKGLKMGAEDYIVKPFDSMELLARIEVVFRRYHKNTEKQLKYHDITIDTKRHEILVCGKPTPLTPKEFELIVYFVKNQDIVIRKERLMAEVWGYDFVGESRTLDTHVQNVRRKLHLQEDLITVPKIGYCLKRQENV